MVESKWEFSGYNALLSEQGERGGLSIYRHHFKLVVSTSIAGPLALFVYRLCYPGGTVALAGARSTTAVIAAVIGIVIGVSIMLPGLMLSQAATVRVVEAARLGEEMRISEALGAFKGRFWRILGIVVSVFARALAGGVLFIGAGAIALALAATLGYNSRVEAGTIGYICGGIAAIAAIIVSIAIYVRYALAVPACVMEDIGRRAALKRSGVLTEGYRSRVVLVYGGFIILFLLLELVLGSPTLLLRAHGIALRISGAVASLVAGALTAPVATVGMCLAYFDERARKDAFERQARMAVADPPPEQPQ